MVESIGRVNVGDAVWRPRFIRGITIPDAEYLVLFDREVSAHQILFVRSIIGVVGSRELSLNVTGTADPASCVGGFTARRSIAIAARSFSMILGQIEFGRVSGWDGRCRVVNSSTRLEKGVERNIGARFTSIRVCNFSAIMFYRRC